MLRAVPGSVLMASWRRTDWSNAICAWKPKGAASIPIGWCLLRSRRRPNIWRGIKNADLFLDTLPCNAHTTASDALWAGLPVLTCDGNTFAGRVAGSLLAAVGLPELVAASPEDYERKALALAGDPQRLTELRATLRRNRDASALLDLPDIGWRISETAYARMWATWRAGEKPAGFWVGDG